MSIINLIIKFNKICCQMSAFYLNDNKSILWSVQRGVRHSDQFSFPTKFLIHITTSIYLPGHI